MKLRKWVKYVFIAIYIVAFHCATMLEATHPTLALVLSMALLMPVIAVIVLLAMV